MSEDRKRYKLTYRKHDERWTKVYRKKRYYFPLEPGEDKKSSNPRVLAEWEKLKASIDLNFDPEAPYREAWRPFETEVRELMERLINLYGDTRKVWNILHDVYIGGIIEPAIKNHRLPTPETLEIHRSSIPKNLAAIGKLYPQRPRFVEKLFQDPDEGPMEPLAVGKPPWDEHRPKGDSQLQTLLKTFTDRIDGRRRENVKRDLNAFLAFLPKDADLATAFAS